MILLNFQKRFFKGALLLLFLFINLFLNAQFSLEKIFGFALDGNIQPVLNIIANEHGAKLSFKDSTIKVKFEERFKYTADKSNYLSSRSSAIDSILFIYQDYWRRSLLDNTKNYEDNLKSRLANYLALNYKPAKKLNPRSTDEAISKQLKNYIASVGLHTTGYSNTGKYKDLLVWRTEKDTTYKFEINGEKISARVFLMDDFITLGWEEYATIDKLHPGGWATTEALYCVKKAYDLNSETFLISYLAHEGRHFSDYKLFPKLMTTDLEYRAKLTELSMANETIYDLLKFFIANANYESENDHQAANYCMIRDLSKILFNTEFEKDLAKWRSLKIESIQEAATTTLNNNTVALKKEGKKVKQFIKK